MTQTSPTPKTAAQMTSCSQCKHHAQHVCVDSNGQPIRRESPLASEPFWFYETCAKNWGLPVSAHYTPFRCKFRTPK